MSVAWEQVRVGTALTGKRIDLRTGRFAEAARYVVRSCCRGDALNWRNDPPLQIGTVIWTMLA